MCIPFCKKQNSETWKKKIFKSSHKNSTGVRSEVISEQTSNLPFLYAPDKDNRKVNFLLSAWGEKNHGWNCRKEGRAEEYFLIRAIKAAQRMRLKKREKDESLIRRSFYRGETGFEPFFAEERAKGAGHVGSPQPFSGARGQKRRVRGPSRWKTASKEGPRQIWQAEGRRGHIWPRKGQKGPASSRTRHRPLLSAVVWKRTILSRLSLSSGRVFLLFFLLLLLVFFFFSPPLPSTSFVSFCRLSRGRQRGHSFMHAFPECTVLCALRACASEDCRQSSFS